MLIATAGHVDHGKTSLVRALTGVETDRLAEEQRRGLTIELGFAFTKAGDGSTIGFIDVPGHHRFMNTMIAGVTGIDLGMLVVAADDGPMPQTIEHLETLRLLGVTEFIAVLSKVDLVDQERLNEVSNQLRSLLPDVEIMEVSTKAGEGVSALSDQLQQHAANYQRLQPRGHFRLFVDRAFTKKGAGLVVTGTSLSGEVNIGDELFLHTNSGAQAQMATVKVRDIHADGTSSTSARSGQRCALNIVGKVSPAGVERGDILCASPDASSATRLDCRFQLAATAPRKLKHLGRVRLYIGARRVSARTYLLSGNDNTEATGLGGSQWVQFILDTGVLAFNGDRILVREESEQHILGGAVVIDPVAVKTKRASPDRARRLEILERNDAHSTLAAQVFQNSEIISLRHHQRVWNVSDAEIEQNLGRTPFEPGTIRTISKNGDRLILSRTNWNGFLSLLLPALSKWHSKNPDHDSIAIDELQTSLSESIPQPIFTEILNAAIRSGQISQHGNRVRLSGKRQVLKQKVDKDWKRLETMMQNRLPLRSEIERELGLDVKQIEFLTRPRLKTGTMFEIGEKRLALSSTLRSFAAMISDLAKHSPFTVIEAKQELRLGRRPTIELLEFFDSVGFTKRSDNSRSIAKPDVVETVLGR